MLPLPKGGLMEVVGEDGMLAMQYRRLAPANPLPPVQVFYKVNRLQPAAYRLSIIPHTSFGDGHVTMSEKCLFYLLFGITSFQKIVREVAGVGPKATKKATRVAFRKNPSKGRLLDAVLLLPPEMLAKSRYVLDNSQRRYV
ncbi:hypothetical protein SeMB42_g00637 [Synchytrium endobioticum]|uniref:Uncharacterized protein n=1 Tax=Synchytrium endobioticum TaxID=286115 RepID=A0A507DPN0_9FUNG|nr:hypothetical protein SeMB42_g00637 [Synchytrium endobioticum]